MLKNKGLVACGILLIVAVVVYSCKSKFEKLRSGTNTTLKYKEGLRLYNAKKYAKALILFDDLIQRYRGQAEAEDLSYYFAYTNYRLRDFTTARYQFKVFSDTYPNSPKAEECRFMAAYCYYLDSPVYSLDQENTSKAIESLQLFITIHPKSERVAEASRLIDDLRLKLETKAYSNAKLYLTTGPYNSENYRAAVIAFKNVLRDYPDTRYAEEVEFLMIRAQFLYAKNSFEPRQEARYTEAIGFANDFVQKYPTSKYLKEAEYLKKDSATGIVSVKKLLALQQAEYDNEVNKSKKDTLIQKNN